VETILAGLDRCGGRAVSLWDPDYPGNLRSIYDPPPLLYVRGTLSERDDYGIAVVGTRAPGPSGAHLAERFAGGLAALGLSVVSGLARGVDTCAHRAAIRSRGRTVAIIGSGVDVIYPPENRGLAEALLERGAIMTEQEPGAAPDAVNFPRRNRIISGITLGTLVVETGVDGGAMITAGLAFDQQREVFAVPSAVLDRKPSGANLLIKQGKAILVETVEDIITELAPRLKGHIAPLPAPSPPLRELGLFEKRLLDAFAESPVHIDILAERAGLGAADALVHLLSLEFKGMVRQLPGKIFARL
jgi:DNA processing protein